MHFLYKCGCEIMYYYCVSYVFLKDSNFKHTHTTVYESTA